MAHDGFDSAMRVASPYEGLIRDGDDLAFDCALFGMLPNDAKRTRFTYVPAAHSMARAPPCGTTCVCTCKQRGRQ